MYTNVPKVTNPDSRTIEINGMYQTSAIRIDDSDISVRKTWSSSKIADALATNARVEMKTTAEWDADRKYIPIRGTICVYTDRKVVEDVNYAGIKVADGLAYICDQPFVGEAETIEVVEMLNAHMNDNVRHVTESERDGWNKKVSVDAEGEKLVLF